MKTSTRGVRVFWLLGTTLLVATVAGSSWMLNQAARGTTPPPPAPESPITGVVGLGFVDIESGISYLHPTQQGRVVSVFVSEGDTVKEGDMLLSLDNQFQKSKLRQAEAELAIAQSTLKDAETQLPVKWKQEIAKQEQQLAAARADATISENELKVQQGLYDAVPKQISEEQLNIAKSKLEAKKAAAKAHEAALEEIKALNPQGTIDRARDQVKAKQNQRDEAHLALVECDLYAPADGSVVRLFATPGDLMTTNQSRQPAVYFCPDAPRIVRVEMLQEWAGKIQKGQVALIEDDTRSGFQWKGKVERISDLFTHRRVSMQEPFQYNDVRTLECIVSMDTGGPPVHIGQRMRVTIKQGGL